jgi:hypothetical protein
MKLNVITEATNTGLDPELRTLLRNVVSFSIVESINIRSKTEYHSYPYYLIESVLRHNIISEGNLTDLLAAGLAGLQSSLTPGVSGDREIMLAVMAPNKGGTQALIKHIQASGSIKGSVANDSNWMNGLFNILNITDENMKKEILEELQSDIAHEAGTSKPSVGSGSSHPAADHISKINEIMKAILNNTVSPKDGSSAILKNAQEMYNAFNGTEDALATESFLAYAAYKLIEEDSVRNKLHIILPESIIAYGAAYGVNVRILSEANWGQTAQNVGSYLKNLPGKIWRGGKKLARGAMNMLTNPGYAGRQINKARTSSDNIRIAKYAVQIAIDKMEERYLQVLKSANLNPDQLVQEYKELVKLVKAGNRTPRLDELENKMIQVYDLFN